MVLGLDPASGPRDRVPAMTAVLQPEQPESCPGKAGPQPPFAVLGPERVTLEDKD